MRSRPARAASTTSSSGTQRSTSSASSSVGANASGAGRRARAPRTARHHLVAAARRRREGDQLPPLGGHQVGLLGELALRRQQADPPRATSSSPAGSSQSQAPTGCRYCLMSSTCAESSTREHRHGSRVVHVVARELVIAEPETVAPDVPHAALDRRAGGSRRPRRGQADRRADPRAAPRVASGVGAATLRPRRSRRPVSTIARASGPRPRTGATPADARARRRRARGTAGGRGSGATAARGAPACRRSTGAPRAAARRTRRACSGEVPENTRPASAICSR